MIFFNPDETYPLISMRFITTQHVTCLFYTLELTFDLSAIMHLYYARFFNHFLHAEGDVPCKEPFVNLLTQGMVMGQSFKVKATGKYLHRDQVDISGKTPIAALQTRQVFWFNVFLTFFISL